MLHCTNVLLIGQHIHFLPYFRPIMPHFIIAFILLSISPLATALKTVDIHQVRSDMLQQYQSLSDELEHNSFNQPFTISSSQRQNLLQGEVMAVIDHDFASTRHGLNDMTDWCETLIFHTNTKACTYEKNADPKVHIYIGRKHYQPIERATRLSMDFRHLVDSDDYLSIELKTDKGPLGTKDYRIQLDAMPLPSFLSTELHSKKQTLLKLSFSYRMNWWSKRATQLYLNTLGQNKVGFTVVNHINDQPVYIDGVQGIIERNTMRYYLAVQTRLEGLSKSLNREQQFALWFDAKQRYALQLSELNRDEYMKGKMRELQNQRQEQRHLDLKLSSLTSL